MISVRKMIEVDMTKRTNVFTIIRSITMKQLTDTGDLVVAIGVDTP